MTTHQDTSTERVKFEAWAKTMALPLDGHGGHYSNIRTRNCWLGWQAALASRDEVAQQPQGQAVSDEQIASIVRAVEDKDKVPSFSNGFYTLTPEELSAFTSAILALQGKPDHIADASNMVQSEQIQRLRAEIARLRDLVDRVADEPNIDRARALADSERRRAAAATPG